MAVAFGAYFLLRNWNGDVTLLIAVGGIAVAGVLAYRVYQSRVERTRADKIERADVASLKEQVKGMLADTANRILEVEGRPGLIASPEAGDHFQKAVSIFVSVDEAFGTATSTYQLRALVSQLDEALWRLEAAEAVVNGQDVPSRPETPQPSRTQLPSTSSSSMTSLSRDAVTKWVDGGSGSNHRRHRRSC